VDIGIAGCVDRVLEVTCLTNELMAGLWKMDMIAMMRAVTNSSIVLLEDLASRLVDLGGMIAQFLDERYNGIVESRVYICV